MTLNGAIMQLVELSEHPMMPVIFRPLIQKVIETISELEEKPEIIRCKDCIYADYMDDIKALWCSEGGRGKTVAPDDYCSYAERREVTT